jgi:malonyl CoA-acyl carrier protein transacylase
MKVFMFPGQGSQYKGMGGPLFDEFKPLVRQADHILGYSIQELCLEDPRKELNRTQFTQPALYVVNALCYLKKVSESGRKPDFLAGHSLGEFNALLAAECFDFGTGLRLVQKRGELMSRSADGGMAAILNASKEQIEDTLRRNDLTNIDLANYNTPSQIVISGLAEEIARAQPFFQEGKVRYYPLNTSGAFHSRFMQAAKQEFQQYLLGFRFANPKIPVVSNVTAKPYCTGEIADGLSKQIASTVRWCESIQYLMALGVGRGEPVDFEEVGQGDVLTKILQTIKLQTPESVLQGYLDAEQRIERAEATPKSASAGEKVLAWNTRYPVGTRVKSAIAADESLETRSAAVVLFGHRAAVYMKGYNGYFDLDELTALQSS